MPDFDLDSALRRPPVPVFVYSQVVIHRGVRRPYYLLMLGPDEGGRATAVALLSVSDSGWVSIGYMSGISGYRWRRVRSPDELQALAEQEAETGPTRAHQHSEYANTNTGTCLPVTQWWREVGGQSA